jgi:hypothetical protein
MDLIQKVGNLISSEDSKSIHNIIAKARTKDKLQVIMQQMLFLNWQANKAINEMSLNLELNKIECRFDKIVGKTYNVYKRPDGSKYFSLLTEEEWGQTFPPSFRGTFMGSFKYEQDMSWSPQSCINPALVDAAYGEVCDELRSLESKNVTTTAITMDASDI